MIDANVGLIGLATRHDQSESTGSGIGIEKWAKLFAIAVSTHSFTCAASLQTENERHVLGDPSHVEVSCTSDSCLKLLCHGNDRGGRVECAICQNHKSYDIGLPLFMVSSIHMMICVSGSRCGGSRGDRTTRCCRRTGGLDILDMSKYGRCLHISLVGFVPHIYLLGNFHFNVQRNIEFFYLEILPLQLSKKYKIFPSWNIQERRRRLGS